jgi:hypothetical protein
MREDLNRKNPVFEALKLKLEKELKKDLESYPLQKSTRRNRTLYHYTNLLGLKAIIENQCFFSSNSAYLNDKKEYYYGIDLFRKCVEEKKETIEDENGLNIITAIQNELDNKLVSFHYVTCFSLDGDLLSQWRAYADDGKGIAIGLDLKKLIEAFQPKANGMYIEYNLESQKEIVEKIVNICYDFYTSELKVLNTLNEPDLYSIIAQEVNEIIDKYVGQFKHSSFSEEKEFRFDLSIDKDYNKSEDLISYRVSKNNLLVPYLELKTNYKLEKEFREKNKMNSDDLEKNKEYRIKQLPITEIIIGPSIDFDLNKQSIRDFLRKNNYVNVNIIPSEVPYRI